MSEPTMNGPLPCPFCGSKNLATWVSDNCKVGYLRCRNCGTKGPHVDLPAVEDKDRTEEQIRKWNTRVADESSYKDAQIKPLWEQIRERVRLADKNSDSNFVDIEIYTQNDKGEWEWKRWGSVHRNTLMLIQESEGTVYE